MSSPVLERTGTLLKLNKGAKTWSYTDVKPKTVHIVDGTLTYSGGGSLGRGGMRGTATVSVQLCNVAQLRQSTIAGAPVGAFDLQMNAGRTYTFAPEAGAKAQGWLGALALAVPQHAPKVTVLAAPQLHHRYLAGLTRQARGCAPVASDKGSLACLRLQPL